MPNFRENIAAAARELGKKAAGASFWLKTTIYSSALSTTNMNLTNLSEKGELEIEDIVIRGNSRTTNAGGGLVGGGTFRIFATNNYGSSIVLAARVIQLGTSRIMSLGMLKLAQAVTVANISHETDLDANQPTILEEGKRLQVGMEKTGSIGDGSVTVHVKFRRLADDADVSVAT